MAPVEDSGLGRFAELNNRLEQLLDQAMKETDSAKYDELCTEIWRVLDEKASGSRSSENSTPQT